MSWLITILRDVPDPRRGNARRHDLLDVLTIALVASICGCESCVEFADFGEDREELFREFLGLENGLPSSLSDSRLGRRRTRVAFGGSAPRRPRQRHFGGCGRAGAPAELAAATRRG